MKKNILAISTVAILSLAFLWFNSYTKSTKSLYTDLENFLRQNNASAQMAEAYRFAQENPQGVLSKVKCYCGCMRSQGHKNDHDCFFNEDGSFDLMGLNCGLCVKTALTAKQMLAEGKSVQEISDYVDQKWGKY